MAMTTEETVLLPRGPARPNPGGRLTLVPPPPSQASPAERFWEALALDRLGPLVAAAAALLGLCAQLKNSSSHPDVEGLRQRVLREIDAFERRVTPLGLAPRAIKASKYALCATIDDIVLNTPWGSRSVWTTRSMVGSLFSETWGGDRFFDLLAQLKKDPGVNVDLLELLYYCMSLGFEGRFRIASRGASELSVLREDVYRLIRAARGEFERDISPHWRGVAAARKLLRSIVPAWVVGAAGVALLLLLYAGLLFALNGRSDLVFDRTRRAAADRRGQPGAGGAAAAGDRDARRPAAALPRARDPRRAGHGGRGRRSRSSSPSAAPACSTPPARR